jgi:hypothetical protein
MLILTLVGQALIFITYSYGLMNFAPGFYGLVTLPIVLRSILGILRFFDRNNLKENKRFQKNYTTDEYRAAVIIRKNKILWMNPTAEAIGVNKDFLYYFKSLRPVDVETSRFFFKNMYFNSRYDILGKTVRINFYSPNGQKVRDYYKENRLQTQHKSNLITAVEKCFSLSSYLLQQNGKRVDLALNDTPIYTNVDEKKLVQLISPIFKIIHFYLKVSTKHNVKVSYYNKHNLAGLTVRFDKSHSLKLMNLLIPEGKEKQTVRQILSRNQQSHAVYRPKIYVEESELHTTLRYEFIKSKQPIKVVSEKVKFEKKTKKTRDLARKRALFTA